VSADTHLGERKICENLWLFPRKTCLTEVRSEGNNSMY
jgi:hypothetical protein